MVPEQPVSPGAELGVHPTARPQKTGANFTMLLSTVGESPLGIQASQLLAVARWAQTMAGPGRARVAHRAAPELFCLDLYKEFDVEGGPQ
jgi:hypothetical protein